MPFQLIKDRVSHDTVEALRTLLEGAENGEITGLIYGATLKREKFITNTAGYLHHHPTFARGIAAALDDELAGMVHNRDAGDTR